jgi:type IV pilus assembly protein PilB
LVRRLCGSCKQSYTADADECRILDVDPNSPPTIYKSTPTGCSMCAGMGYKGRVAVAEVLLFDDDMDEMVAQSASKADLKKIAVEKGFKSMKDDGVLKVLDGTTSIEALSKAVDTSK